MASEVKKRHQHIIYFCGTLNVNKIIKLLTLVSMTALMLLTF